MLRELHICNLAVIEDVAIELAPGLNVFTGQTGAGKSLIIGAFEMLLGLRATGAAAAEMLRTGCDEGRVTGVFEVRDPAIAAEVSRCLDQTVEPGDPLLITRKLFASGRSTVSVNGLPATAAMVRQTGELLVDIHGQHDHQYLLRPSNQLLILDAFARCEDTRHRFAATLARLRELRQEHEQITATRTLRRQQLDLYEFQAQEIDRVEPQAGEFPELQARHSVLSNLHRIIRDAGSAHAALYEAEGSVVERLQMIAHLLLELAELDPTLEPTSQQVREATLTLQEAAFELSRYVDRLDHDPAELAEVDARLNELNRLIQKYGDAPAPGSSPESHAPGSSTPLEVVDPDDLLAPVLAYRQQIGEQIEKLRGQDEGLATMDRQIHELQQELAAVGAELTAARTAAARKLRPLIEAQLAELGMSEAKFDVLFEAIDPDGEAVSPSGLDAIEMAVQTNPGQAMQPLRKIASGGELSRIMLALKSILAGSDRISVLVFDEIDANIGGRLGSVIGRKLRELANAVPGGDTRSSTSKKRKVGGNAKADEPMHQVLCITHLPQIAAFADRHLRIAKAVTGKGASKQTHTTVTALAGAERIEELAEMMAGKQATETTRQQAREMLEAT